MCSSRRLLLALSTGVAKQLDAAVAAFHGRPLKNQYRVLVLDGVVRRRKTGAGAIARPVLVVLGLRSDGKKEVVDFRLASAKSTAQWEQFLGDLVRRGLILGFSQVQPEDLAPGDAVRRWRRGPARRLGP